MLHDLVRVVPRRNKMIVGEDARPTTRVHHLKDCFDLVPSRLFVD